MSASLLSTVLANQAHDAERIGDVDRITAWWAVVEQQQHTNP